MKGEGAPVLLAAIDQIEAGDLIRVRGQWSLVSRVTETGGGRPLIWTVWWGALSEADLPRLIEVA